MISMYTVPQNLLIHHLIQNKIKNAVNTATYSVFAWGELLLPQTAEYLS